MPLLDHFHPPLSQRRHWENLHSAWANALRDHLNSELLPPRYFAEVQITVGNRVEIDVASFEETTVNSARNGGVAVWAPPEPPLVATLQFTAPDLFELRIINDEEGPRLVAAVELVSPSNKDRPGNRHAFAVKCGSYLQAGAGLVIVDVVTARHFCLHSELLEMLQVDNDCAGLGAADLYACAYRTVPATDNTKMHIWPERLMIGAPLPTLPLWIGPDLCLPLELERAYAAACVSSRIDG